MSEEVVVVSTLGEGDRQVGRLTLNVPRILNSLDAEMIEIMLGKLLEWAEDDSIAAVYIDGEGRRPFAPVAMFMSCVGPRLRIRVVPALMLRTFLRASTR